ncbi:FecR family protein [Chitinophaga filiformis]|uniref:FecR domain-containing protein n=1 Tax=Chitinophaga filiformis TaxID=104663 RepID=A0ABY4I082_CHIFI|nr:FecR domain-containing protein [Chitinophaga filiformis]UPK68101.1 FecR domain-containing protein [Chitinophaga filiformis]
MQAPEIKELLEKYKKGVITDEEMALLETWYLQWRPEPLDVSAEELETLKSEVWQSLHLQDAAPVRRHWRKQLAAAAAVLVLLGAALYFLGPGTGKKPDTTKMVAVRKQANEFMPGSNRATLTLSNGQQIVLTNAQNGELAEDASVAISKKADGELVYDHPRKQEGTGPALNTLAAPRGGQYHLTLSDGTQVWLNAASSITYPVSFNGKERSVTVRGEAYFEVAQLEGQPFKVHTARQEITVLGTHFNVKAYPDDPDISTTLLTGSVKVTNMTSGIAAVLKPGQQASTMNAGAQLDVRSVDAEDAISWKNGYFLFDDQDITSIMKIISRWYDVDIEYKGPPGNERFGGTFSRASYMPEILTNLERIGHVHFELFPGKVTVTTQVQ